jgi:putative NADH-flavin reductase
MRIAIFGSTGKTGHHLVRQAKERGWDVNAFARTAEDLGELREGVKVVEGNIHDSPAVERAIDGTDAVISALGPTESSSDDLLEVAAEHIVEGMQRRKVGRLVTMSATGATSEQDKPPVSRGFLVTLMDYVADRVIEDGRRHADIIRDSDLEWVIVRPSRLTDEQATGSYRSGYLPPAADATIPRADVAEFMLDQLLTDMYVREMPFVTT